MIDSEARLLTDENAHPQVVSFLRGRGCDVLDVKELGWMGTSDPEIVRRAADEHRTILTHDRDFGRLLMKKQLPVMLINRSVRTSSKALLASDFSVLKTFPSSL